MKQHMVTILHHNSKITGGMCLLGFRQVYALCSLSFLLSSIRLLVFFFIQQNHIEALISISTLSLSSIIDATKLFKVLRVRYCMEVPVLHDRSQDHAHYLFYVYRSIDRDHVPFMLVVSVTTHLQVGRLIQDTLV